MEKNICFQVKKVIIFKQGGILVFFNVAVLRNNGGFLVFFLLIYKTSTIFFIKIWSYRKQSTFTIVSWFLLLVRFFFVVMSPWDAMSTRLQDQMINKYKRYIYVLMIAFKSEGLMVLYRGGVQTIIFRIVQQTVLFLTFMEQTMYLVYIFC